MSSFTFVDFNPGSSGLWSTWGKDVLAAVLPKNNIHQSKFTYQTEVIGNEGLFVI